METTTRFADLAEWAEWVAEQTETPTLRRWTEERFSSDLPEADKALKALHKAGLDELERRGV